MSVLNKVIHYQKKIERNNKHVETLIHCINKLHKLPITGQHLEKTGIGKTINALRKLEGDVGDAAKVLVWKWKRVVFAETIAEEKAKKERGLTNPIIINADENFLKGLKAEEEQKAPAYITEETGPRPSAVAATEGAKKLQDTCKEEYSNVTANLNCSNAEYESQRSDILQRTSKGEGKGHSSADSVNRSSTKTQKQKGGHHRSHSSKHRHSKRDKREHTKKTKENGIKIKLSKVHTENESSNLEENKSFNSSALFKNKHCGKLAESENKSSVTEHCRKERDQKRRTRRTEKSTESISEQSKYSENVKIKFPNDGSGDYYAEKIRMGNKSSTTTSNIRNSDSGSSPRAKINYSPASKREIHPVNPDLYLLNAKPEPLDVNIDLASVLPEIPSKAFSHLPLTEENPAFKYTTKHVPLPKQHRQRTKVYSGKKTGKPFPTLYELCVHVLKEHIDALQYTGGVPYDILKPILQQATPEQLFQVEYYNAYLLEDTNELWEFHCRKEFPSSQLKPMETAREMYLRCLEEREAKFKALTYTIQQSLTKSSSVRRMKLAYIDSEPKPPRNVAREQEKHDTGNIPKSDSGKLQRNASTSAATFKFFKNSTNSTARKKPRIAPLMKKTMKLAKSFKR